MKRFLWLALAVAWPAGVLSGSSLLTDLKPQGPKVGVELLADRSAGVPGGTVELSIKFKLEDGWHIY